MSNRRTDTGPESGADGDARRPADGDGEDDVGAIDPAPDATVPDPDEERLPAPHTERSPEQALKIVLEALRDNDHPFEDAGLRTAFNFASPQYRSRVGGSLEEFVQELTDPINAPLVDHEEAKRGRLEIDDGEASERVIVTDDSGEHNTYEFFFRKVGSGKYENCWMLDAVDLVYVGAAPDHQFMPMVEFDGVELKCKEGETLRNVLLRASGVSPYNSTAEVVNCGGNGLCGTCAVEVSEGEVTEAGSQEKRRLGMPPFNGTEKQLRLSCQCDVLSDLVVHKHEGTWGQHVEQYTAGSEEEPGEPIYASDEEYLGETTGAGDDVEDAERRAGDDDLDLSEEAASLLEEAAEELEDDS